jgi:hypothetical protein
VAGVSRREELDMADAATKKVKAPVKKATPAKAAASKPDLGAELAKEFALAFADEGMSEEDATKYGRVAANLISGDE